MGLNYEQAVAVEAMERFLQSDEEFFILKGPAGTGKTYCIRELIPRVRGRLVFTAPTNKATKELRASVSSEEYKPECCTIYSLLGLKLEANGEVKELTNPEDPIDLSKFVAVIVDEGSMINANLFRFIKQTAEDQQVKFIFMGDDAQLPPVGEKIAPIWELENIHSLTKVMRHDNQILKLATALRNLQSHPAPQLKFTEDNDGEEGVWLFKSSSKFHAAIQAAARAGDFSKSNASKACAWRNVTVDALNKLIRAEIFDNAAEHFWLPTDRIILTSPARDLGDSNRPIGTTDDEGSVERVTLDYHPVYSEFKCWKLDCSMDDNRTVTFWALHENSLRDFKAEVERRAAEARINHRRWGLFWEFQESFHQVRHAYALTAHRAQGSTYDSVYVDWQDIFLNRNRLEALKCLYVACTRPKRRLFLA